MADTSLVRQRVVVQRHAIVAMQKEIELKEDTTPAAPTAVLRVGPDEEFETIDGAAATLRAPEPARPAYRARIPLTRAPLAHGSRDRTMHGWRGDPAAARRAHA